MAVEVQVLVAAGGDWWDMVVLTQAGMLTTSHFPVQNHHHNSNSSESSTQMCGICFANCQEKDYVGSESTNQEYESDKILKSQICTSFYSVNITNWTSVNSALKGKNDLVVNKCCGKALSLHYETEGLYFAVFLRELQISHAYRQMVLQYLLQRWKTKYVDNSPNGTRERLMILWKLKDTVPYIIDDRWCLRMNRCAQERQHLDTSMSWLSTLGGACSALGDYDAKFAERAGKISVQQLEIAVRLGDPMAVSRCRLYAAIALIQKHRFRMAKSIIRREYRWVDSLTSDLQDPRLIRMCHGIWAKLIYEKNYQHSYYAQEDQHSSKRRVS